MLVRCGLCMVKRPSLVEVLLASIPFSFAQDMHVRCDVICEFKALHQTTNRVSDDVSPLALLLKS